MFGFSGLKLLLTLFVIALVWFGYKYLGRLAEMKAEKDSGRSRVPPHRRAPTVKAEDLERCSDCGAYVPEQQRACGRPGCPYPGK